MAVRSAFISVSVFFAVVVQSPCLFAQEEMEDATPPLPKAAAKSSKKSTDRSGASSSAFTQGLYMTRSSLVFDIRRDRIMHEPVEALDPTNAKWEVDLIFLHFGFSVAIDQEIQFEGRRIEAYMPSVDMGMRFHLPFTYVQPFMGAGYTLGWVAASDPNNRGSHDITVIWQGSRSGTWGFYAEAGADFLVPVADRFGLGLRAYVRYGSLTSESIPDLGGRQINSLKLTPYMGIVAAF